MKLSARNVLKGKVKSVKQGEVNSEVTVQLPGGLEIVSVITKTAADNLSLREGKDVYAIVKASNVILGTD
ncbi:MAG TPA: molybdopterin-binding protein [Terriglobales bacterium]|nr:molybdopterin-binding protein [Terriglobales bacterium]